jgi:uncharacterized phage-associated protein
MKKNNVISFQEAATNPAFQSAIYAIQQHGASLAVTDKFLEGQRELIEEELEAIFEHSQNLPLHFVLSKVMENMPDYLSGSILLDLTRFAIDKWEKMQENTLQLSN